MRKLLGLLGLVLLLVAACAPSQVGVGSTYTPPSGGGVRQNPAQVQTIDDLVKQTQADTEAKNKLTDIIVIPITSKTGSTGDLVVFGTMFNNLNSQGDTYIAQISFVEGRDSNSNPIEVDKNTIKTWIQNPNILDFTLDQTKQSQFVPMIFKIGSEIKPGVSTVPGTYQFSILFSLKNKYGSAKPVNNGERSVYLKVQ